MTQAKVRNVPVFIPSAPDEVLDIQIKIYSKNVPMQSEDTFCDQISISYTKDLMKSKKAMITDVSSLTENWSAKTIVLKRYCQ